MGQTPLIVAIRAANVRAVRVLLKYGANANQPERNSSLKAISYGARALWSPFHFAVGYDLVPKGPGRLGDGNSPRLRENIVRLLLQSGAVNAEKHTKSVDPCADMSPLFLHITNGPSSVRAAIVRQLLQHGAEGNRPSLCRVQWIPETTRMVSPLSLVVAKCRRNEQEFVPDEVLLVVPLLISAGDGGGRRTTSGAPLIMDCLNPCENMRWVQLAEMLLSSRRQSAGAVHTNGEPAVVWLIVRLLEYELWFNYNHLYATRMERQHKYERVRSSTFSMLQLLLSHGADINARCPANHSKYPGATALMIAARVRDDFHDVFLDLLESGANAKARDSKGRTAVFGLFAGRLSNPNDRVRALSEAGTPMNAADKNGDTVLHYAAKHSRRDFSHWLPKLLAHGCDLEKKNKQGETFVDVLCKNAPSGDLDETRARIVEGIQQAKQDAARVKKQERVEKYRMKLAADASTTQSSASIAQIGPGTTQAGPSTAQTGQGPAQVSGYGNSSRPGSRPTPAGPKALRICTKKKAQGGSGAAQAGPSTALVAAPSQRRPDRDVRNNTAETTHTPAQAGPGTPRSYAMAVKTPLEAAQARSRAVVQAGSRAVAQAAPRAAQAAPRAAQAAPHAARDAPGAAPTQDNKPPGFW